MLLRQAIVAGFDWVDLEMDIAKAIPRFGKVKRIVSYHNMREVPDNLEKIYKEMCGLDADVVKIAVTAGQTSDNLARARAAEEGSQADSGSVHGGPWYEQPDFVRPAGDALHLWRVQQGAQHCSGHPVARRTARAFIISRQVNAETRVFGVIGDPVAHSLSPLIHNRGVSKAGQRQGVSAFPCAARRARRLLERLRPRARCRLQRHDSSQGSGGQAGPNQDAGRSRRIGAANTLVRTQTGWHASNTDAQAALDALTKQLARRRRTAPVCRSPSAWC